LATSSHLGLQIYCLSLEISPQRRDFCVGVGKNELGTMKSIHARLEFILRGRQESKEKKVVMCIGLLEYPACQPPDELTEATVMRAQCIWNLVPKHILFSSNNNNDNNKNRVT